jgi:Short C-terminal domain
MGEHAAEAAQAQDAALRQYVQNATTTSPADELTKLADLHASGAIDDAEYQQLKAKVLA